MAENHKTLTQREFVLRKYEAKMSFLKVLVGTAAVGVVGATAPALVQYYGTSAENQRKINELVISQEAAHQEYIKDFLRTALDQNIELRIRFAHYFANVSRNEFSTGWETYLADLESTRETVRKEIHNNERERYELWSKNNRNQQEQVRLNEIERKLDWLYTEVGYVAKNQPAAESGDKNPDVVNMYGPGSGKQLADLHADQRRLCVDDIGAFNDQTKTAIAIFRRTQANLPTPVLDGEGPFFDLTNPQQRVQYENFKANTDTGRGCDTSRFINVFEASRLKHESQVKDFTDRVNELEIVGVDLKVTKTIDGNVTLNDPVFRLMVETLRNTIVNCGLNEEIYDGRSHITRNLDIAIDNAIDDDTCYK